MCLGNLDVAFPKASPQRYAILPINSLTIGRWAVNGKTFFIGGAEFIEETLEIRSHHDCGIHTVTMNCASDEKAGRAGPGNELCTVG